VAHRHAEARSDQYGISMASLTTAIDFFPSSNQHFSFSTTTFAHQHFLILSFRQPNNFTMAFFKSLLIASVAVVAYAASHDASDGNKKIDVSSQGNSPKCGNGQKIACCNSGEDLIGLNCLSIPIGLSTGSLNSNDVETDKKYSCRPDPTGLRFQRRCLLPDWRCFRKHTLPRLPQSCFANTLQGNLINIEADCLAIPL
jgi:hypothetical protein